MSEYVRLLTQEGERVEHPDYDVALSPEQLRGMYRDLVIVRRIDREGVTLARQGELSMWVPLLGQEAAQIGSARALAPGDMAFPSYREHGVLWCRGMDPLRLFAFFRGVTLGDWDPRECGCHLYTIVVGGQVLHATGYAMGIQRDHTDDAVIVYFGDGATSQGDVNEAFSWAAVFNVPVVFFCQNNRWAISQPVERQSKAPLYRRSHGFGFPGIQVDGNDVLACHAVTAQALEHARRGRGPVLVEARTYRMDAHTTSDDPSRYRSDKEVSEWQQKDPIKRMRMYLTKGRLADDEFFDTVDAEAERIGAEARKRCVDLPDPVPLEMFDHVYTAPHPLLAEERDQFAGYLDSFLDQR
ncbi:MAG TPA: pyruvate dehydrogenase (acetyl-transferring) E1 component subunit alpha [Streptosporangiaceae bacterium]